jgi:hypothetical protein
VNWVGIEERKYLFYPSFADVARPVFFSFVLLRVSKERKKPPPPFSPSQISEDLSEIL